MKTKKRESENCMDFIEAVHRRRVYPLMYCYAELSGRLDVDILKQAVSASSQFVPEILCAYDYQHNRFIDKGFTAKDVIHTAETALPQWELDKAPQFRITVCQKRHTASVIFGMSHILADGKGFLQYLYLLAALYNGKNPDVHNKREISSVLDGIHVGRQTMRIRYGKAPAVQPMRSQSQCKNFFCLCSSISENDFTAIRTKAKYSHATLNDVFMAAYARVIACRQSVRQVAISCPADLRRFHPMSDTLTVANMTGIYREIPVDVSPDDKFSRTLSQISIEMNLQKSRRRCFSGIPFFWDEVRKLYHNERK